MKNIFRRLLDFLPDRLFIKLKYYHNFGKFPNLKRPITYNEKLQWLKLYDRQLAYIKMVDKYEMKKFVSNKIGEDYIVTNYGIWNDYNDIPFEQLPQKFVLKTTHDSGGVVVCKNKDELNHEEVKAFIKKHLRYNYFYEGREWPYKKIKPRIIAEEYLENSETEDLKDYKIFTFNGEAKVLFIASDRQTPGEETKFDFFDMEFRHLDIINGHPNAKATINKPMYLNEMKEIAEILSEGIPHLRVDFYEADGKLYVGELTFFHYSGMVPFEPTKWDCILGEWLHLPEK